MVTSTSGIYISGDLGDTWRKTLTNAANTLSVSDKLLIAGTSGSAGVYLSTDRGDTWSQSNNGLLGHPPGVNSSVITDERVLIGTFSHGVFVSSDQGASWTQSNEGLGSIRINSLDVNGNYMFAGTRNGLYLSNDQGDSWHLISDGLPSKPNIGDLAINNAYVFTNISLGGMWRGFPGRL